MKKTFTILLTISIVLAASIVRADQNDPRLEALFVELKNISSPNQAKFLSSSIWQIWAAHDSSEINQLYVKGDMAMRNQDPQTALEYFSRVIELAPDFAEGWNKRATIYYLMGDYQASLADIEETLKLEPRHFGALSGRGLCYLELQQFDLALNSFEQALKVNPWLLEVHRNVKLLKTMIMQQVS
jgi:tetratricopeptide (TPR) repeat protein